MRFGDAEARSWADKHVAVWNTHDLDAIGDLYTPNAVLRSPLARAVVGADEIAGADALRAYFGRALERFPDLQFGIVDVLRGVETVTIYYTSVGGRLVAEVCFVEPDGRISRVLAHYSTGAGATGAP